MLDGARWATRPGDRSFAAAATTRFHEVEAGPLSIRLDCRRFSGTGEVSINRPSVTVMFVADRLGREKGGDCFPRP